VGYSAERSNMTTETYAIATAASALTHAMSNLVKAIDGVSDDGAAVRHLPEDLPEALERLVSRISAAQGLSG
jgi:hypothetical protein